MLFRNTFTVETLVCISFSTRFEADRASHAFGSVQYSVTEFLQSWLDTRLKNEKKKKASWMLSLDVSELVASRNSIFLGPISTLSDFLFVCLALCSCCNCLLSVLRNMDMLIVFTRLITSKCVSGLETKSDQKTQQSIALLPCSGVKSKAPIHISVVSIQWNTINLLIFSVAATLRIQPARWIWLSSPGPPCCGRVWCAHCSKINTQES